MSFGQELKDFASSYKTVKGAQEDSARTDYYKAMTDKMKKGPVSASDPDGVMSGVDAEGNPQNDSMDTNAPHGKLYNLGKWLGLTGETAPAVNTGPVSATQLNSRQQALPLDNYDASQDGGYDTPDASMNGYAKGGLVAAVDPDTLDDGGPDAGDGAIPTEAITVSAPRKATGVLSAKASPAVYNDGGPDAGTGALPTEHVTSTGNRPVPVPTPRPDDAPAADPTVSETTTASADRTAPAAIAAPDVAADVADSQGGEMGDIGQALHAGIMNLQHQFNLDPKAGAVPDQQSLAKGRKALFDGEGRAAPEDMQAVAAAVDPNGELTHSQMILRAMTKGYEHYMAKGDPQRAANFASQIIQYSTFEAARHGSDALDALRKGDINGAAQSLKAGYDNIPDGKEATGVKVNPDKTVSVTESDVKTGKPINQHTLSPQQLYQAALGLKNKTLAWQSLMTAANGAKGYTPPESEAYTAAQLKLAGANPDGTLTDAGNSGPAAGGGAQAIPTESSPAPAQAGPQSGNLITRADPNAMHLVESNNNPNAVSPKGASGVGQTMQGTLLNPGYGVAPAKDNSAAEKQRVADDYLKAMVDKYGPVVGHVAYNWGPGNAERWLASGANFRALPAETREYLGSIAVAQDRGQQQSQGQPGLQPASYTTSAPSSGATLRGPLTLKPGDQKQTGAQPSNPLALRPALDEDQAPPQPVEPTMTQLPERPKPPKQVSMGDFDTSTMGPKERLTIQKEIVQKNIANRAKFQEDMKLWTSQASEAKANFAAEHQKYTDAVKANKPGKDPYSLPVKDRGDALTQLQQARSNFDKDPSITGLSKAGQGAVSDIAYGLYTHNETTPDGAVKMAAAMLNPGVSMKNGKINISTPFQVHATADPNKVRVVYGKQKLLMPANAFDQLAAARGNEISIARKKLEAGAKNDGSWNGVIESGKKFAKGTLDKPKRAGDSGETITQGAERWAGDVGGALGGAADAVGRALKPSAISAEDQYATNN